MSSFKLTQDEYDRLVNHMNGDADHPEWDEPLEENHYSLQQAANIEAAYDQGFADGKAAKRESSKEAAIATYEVGKINGRNEMLKEISFFLAQKGIEL